MVWQENSSGGDEGWSGHGQVMMVKLTGFEDESHMLNEKRTH